MGAGVAYGRVTAALAAYGSEQHGHMWNCPTPAHSRGDVKKSLSVTTDDRGVGLCCHMGCTAEEIVQVIGLTLSDLFDEEQVPVSREVARYAYCNGDGEILFAKVRYEPKSFSIVHPNGAGWEHGLGGARRVLYNYPEVKRALALNEIIYICEGEKDCDRLAREGLTATTNFDGASKGDQKPKWRPEYTDMLAGAKNIIIVADRDEPGYAHARAIKESLTGRVGTVRILQAAVSKQGADVSDHLDAGFKIEQLIPIDNDVSRLYRVVDWQEAWKQAPEEVSWLKEPFLERGTINALFGQPGVGKSLITLEVAVEIVRAGGTVMYVDDENRVIDTVERLKAFGCKPDELDRLKLYNFAGLPPLDTQEGGMHLAGLADANEPDLVVIDTTSRMVMGRENDADTFLQLYRCSLVPLKGKGITVLRLDHPGKDDSKGQRGSSAKNGDVDTIWCLSKDNDMSFALECQKSRSGAVPTGHMIFLTRELSPLRHYWDMYPNVPKDRTESLIAMMDRLGVPVKFGRDRAREALAEHNVHARNDLLGAAIAHRKQRQAKPVPEPVPSQVSDTGQVGQVYEDKWWEDRD